MMLNKNKRGKLFTRRTLFLAGFKSSLLFTLIGRLYYLQIVKSKEYKTFSDSNRIKDFLIPPVRGKILDRNQQILAGNKNYYRALLDPTIADNNKETIEKLSEILSLSKEEEKNILEKLKKHRSKRSLTIYNHLTWEEVAKIEVNAPRIPGITIDVGQIRFFPDGEASSHVVGYMGPVSEKEIAINPLLNHPDFKIGRSGVERELEPRLRGEAGVRRMEVNAFGLSVRELSREDSKSGEDINLTLDKRIQTFVKERMKNLSGSAVVIDIKDGSVVSFVSTPSFDPNQFTQGVKANYWKSLTRSPDRPLINKAISNQYPPGSTFKIVVALAALEDGFDPNVKIHCPGHMDLGGRRFHCWKKEGHGKMNLNDAIMHSCNIYFYHISKNLDVDKIASMAKIFGLGEESGIILKGEKSGLIPNKEWKRQKYNRKWQKGDTFNVSIGQGYALATPIQLAVMAARIASGKNISPHLVTQKDITHDTTKINEINNLETITKKEVKNGFKSLDIKKAHLDLVRDGMRRVMNVAGGTAYGSKIWDEKYAMAGKTGTSQVISKEKLKTSIEHMTEEQIKRTQNHALFIGYAPLSHPRYAISVVVDHGGGGSKTAAPVAKDIMLKVQETL